MNHERADGRTKPAKRRLAGSPEGESFDFGTSIEPAYDALTHLGGVATRQQLLSHVSARKLGHALAARAVVRIGHGRYALANVDTDTANAHALSAVLCLASAALHHGWAVKTVPDRTQVSVRRNRRLASRQLSRAEVHRHDLRPDEITDGVVTNKEVTLMQCLRTLPDDEALAIADSAARTEGPALLLRVRNLAQGRGAARIRRLIDAADARAANPFESVLRYIASRVEGAVFEPQRVITDVDPVARPDLVEVDLRIVLEADSFEWHGDRAALRRDARRYDQLVAAGWIVLRFAWEDVMFDQDFVERVIRAVVTRANRRTNVA
ncbi:DUF559 domain-containing protein [Nocardioides montaniterrae]